MRIVHELAPINLDEAFTSSRMRGIFRGEIEFRGKYQKFHPKELFKPEYSENAPDAALTYTWDTDFRKEIPEYFSHIKEIVDSDKNYSKKFQDMTFWIDIFFIDQNGDDLIDQLIFYSNEIYTTALHHFVLLAFDTLRRGWCLVEVGYRAYAIMAEFRLDLDDLKRMLSGRVTDKEHYSVRYMKKFSESFIVSQRLPQIIFGTSSDLNQDLFSFMGSEILNSMKTSNEKDRPRIFEILTELFGTTDDFDSVIHEFAFGGTQLVAEDRHGVREPSPSLTPS